MGVRQLGMIGGGREGYLNAWCWACGQHGGLVVSIKGRRSSCKELGYVGTICCGRKGGCWMPVLSGWQEDLVNGRKEQSFDRLWS